MGCPAEQAFVDLVEEQLDETARTQLHDHVSDCDSCRHLLAALARTRRDATERVAHYEIERTIGRGGMGVVYRAMDTRLRRVVALKVLSPHLAGDERATARLLREARAASALDHPHVAQVYDVGNDDQTAYIALAFYDGETLRDRLQRGPLEPREAATLLHQMALGLGCAHAAGIVHRDVKPSNVLITSSGVRLVDFGLAKLASASTELTETGQMLGTVAYMAPEQHGGESDARADVWSLGVTGYEMLAGAPPFRSSTAVGTLNAARSVDPAAPPAPAALQAILMTCLEKNPERRYANAGEVARDLARFLGGERVTARRPGVVARALRVIGRHRALAIALVVGIVAALVAAGVVVRARRAERLRIDRAERLGQAAQRMRMQIKNAYLLPLHDTSPERAAVRAEMSSIEDEVRRLGPDESGLAEYALGSGAAALKEHAAARQHLEAAWNAGQRKPEVAFTLALTLVHLYGARREDLRRVPPGERDAAAKKLGEEIRDPALRYLRAAQGEGPPGAIEALIAVYEDRDDDAIRLTSEVFARSPSEYEFGELNARTRMYRAFRAWYAGDKDALQQFDALEETLQKVLAVARSDPHMYLDTAIRVTRMTTTRAESGAPHLEPVFERAIDYAEKGEVAGPDEVEAFNAHTDALSNFAVYTEYSGGDGRPILRRAVEVAERGLRCDPKYWRAQFNHGLALTRLGVAELAHGQDGVPFIRRGVVSLEASLAQHDYEDTYQQLASAMWKLGDTQALRGEDPRASYDRAAALMRKTLAIDASNAIALGNLGSVLGQRITWEIEHGSDAATFIAEAIAVLEKAEKLAVQDDFPPSVLATILTLQARYQLAAGADPKASLTRAIAEGERAIGLSQTDPDPPGYVADALRLRAVAEERAGADFTASLATGRDRMALSRRRSPSGGVYLSYYEARLELLAPRGLPRARAVIGKLLERDPNDPIALVLAATMHRLAKECAAGDAAIEHALSINSKSARALWERAQLDETCAPLDPASRDLRLQRANSSRAEAQRIEPFIARDPG